MEIIMLVVLEEQKPFRKPRIEELDKGACFTTADSFNAHMPIYRIMGTTFVETDADDQEGLLDLLEISVSTDILVMDLRSGCLVVLSKRTPVIVVSVSLKVDKVSMEMLDIHLKSSK